MGLAGWLPGLAALESHGEQHGRRPVEQNKYPFPRCCFYCQSQLHRQDRYIPAWHSYNLAGLNTSGVLCWRLGVVYVPRSPRGSQAVCVVMVMSFFSAAQMSSSETCWQKTRKCSSCTRVRFFRRRSVSCTSCCTFWTTVTGTTRRSKRWSRSAALIQNLMLNKNPGIFCSVKKTDFLLSGWTMHKQAEDDEASSCSEGPEGCQSC